MSVPKISLLISTDRESDRDFLRGIVRYCETNGPWELISKPPAYIPLANSEHEWNIHKNSDGFIARGFESLSKILKFKKPVIASGIKRETNLKIATVVTNSKVIGQLGAQHLMSLGLTNFAYCGFSSIEWSKKRQTSFVSELRKAGYTSKTYNLYTNSKEKDFLKAKEKLANWLMSLPKPIGIMTCNDDCAMLVIETVKNLNIRIPEQIAIVGVDNDELICNLTAPPLSSIDINFEKSGFQAAKLLDRMIKENKQIITQIKVEPVEIVERQSTNILQIQNETIAAAMQYIYQNFKSAIQVEDVARHVGLSRRALEKQFKNNLNRTIYSEIREMRLNHIAKLLTKTNMTVSEIMTTLDYSSPEHIARQFRNIKGISPIEYRKKHSKTVNSKLTTTG